MTNYVKGGWGSVWVVDDQHWSPLCWNQTFLSMVSEEIAVDFSLRQGLFMVRTHSYGGGR